MKFCDILLFKNMSEQEITQMSKSKFMKKRIYAKNTHIYHMGDVIDSVGIVLSGNVIIENIDIWGNKSIISYANEGEIFAETYALSQTPMMVDVVCAECCEILFINLKSALKPENSNQPWYPKFMNSLLMLSAQKKSCSFTKNFLHFIKSSAYKSSCLSVGRIGKSRFYRL